MSSFTTFDDLEQAEGAGNANQKPFFKLIKDGATDDQIHQWLKDTLMNLKMNSWFRLEKVKNNYLRYKAIQYNQQVYQPRDIPETRKKYMPQIVVPIIRDAVDEKVARLLEFKPAIAVIPVHDEEMDKVDAKVAKRFLSHLDYVERLDEKFHKFTKNSKNAGESFLWGRWNPDAGDMVDGADEGTVLESGFELKEPIAQGDIETKIMTPNWVYYQEDGVFSWEDVEHIFLIEPEDTEKLKVDYPMKADDIRSESQSNYFDFESMTEKAMVGKSYKVTFYHKKTKYLRGGYEAVFTTDALLKKGGLSYKLNKGKFPVVRLIDTENEEELHGESSTEFTRGIASQYNNLGNMIIKQQMLCSYPKWMVEADSVDTQSLGNDVGIVKLAKGANAPVLAQANPVSPQLFDFRKELKQEFYDMMKSNSVVRGEPPPGVTAFVAMQYLSESESRRMNADVVRVNTAIRDTYDLLLQLAGQFYKPTDKRTMYILGKDNNWERQTYDPSSLAKPYNVMLQNQSALPDSKALRTQFILDMREKMPNFFTEEQCAEMLNFSQSEKFLNIMQAAAVAAEAENEMILDGKAQMGMGPDGVPELLSPDPKEWELHHVHWKVHTQKMQDIGFKTKAPLEVQEAMKQHVLATEMLMFEQGLKNPVYAQFIQQSCPQFPMLWTPPPPPPMPPIDPATGEPLPPEMMGDMPPMDPLPPEGPPPGMMASTNSPIGGEAMPLQPTSTPEPKF